MKRFLKFFIVTSIIYLPIIADQIGTFYGPIDVQEPIILELIESPPFQRLKHINQYGVAHYTTHREEYTRYEHSLGVFALLYTKGFSLEEQIAGLLHDVSHTVFSHVGDWIFNRQNLETDYQTMTHSDYLKRSGLENILQKYGYTAEDFLPTQEQFPGLEQPLPNLCADRLDYNLQGAFHQGFITYDEAVRLFNEIQFIEGNWISSDHNLLKKLVRFSIFMSQDCWGSGTEAVLSMWLAKAILQGVHTGLMSIEDIRFGVDQVIWEFLLNSKDPLIKKNMHMILHSSDYHYMASPEEANHFVICKFRGIDPLIYRSGKKVRLTSTDPTLSEEFQSAKWNMARGWHIKLVTDINILESNDSLLPTASENLK